MSLHDDLVSVVIPVYNSEKFLAESIESVLNQSYENIEIITIDDGSTDSSSKILQKYSDKIIILSQKNQGLALALKAGISKMNGKWFKWLSPDDVLFPNAIETLVKTAKKFPNNTIIYSNWDLIDQSGKKLRKFTESNYNNLSKFEYNIRLLDGQQINVNTSLIPIQFFDKGCRFRELKDPVAIDYDFFLRASLLFDAKFYLIPQSLIKYRVNKNQLSHTNIAKTLSYLKELRNEILSQISDEEHKRYLEGLSKYDKNKSISKKTLEIGLKFSTKALPDKITDKLLVFYLNKIRRTR